MVTFITMDFSGVRIHNGTDLDYPTAWAIQHEVGASLEHHPRCSSVPGWSPISGPAFLCDCGAVEREWERRMIASAATGPGEEPEDEEGDP